MVQWIFVAIAALLVIGGFIAMIIHAEEGELYDHKYPIVLVVVGSFLAFIVAGV